MGMYLTSPRFCTLRRPHSREGPQASPEATQGAHGGDGGNERQGRKGEGVAPPKQAEKEGAAAPDETATLSETPSKNAAYIDAGVKKLEKEGETAFISHVVSNLRTALPLPTPSDNSTAELFKAACEPWEVFSRGANCASPHRPKSTIEVFVETGRRVSVSIQGEPEVTTLAAAKKSKQVLAAHQGRDGGRDSRQA